LFYIPEFDINKIKLQFNQKKIMSIIALVLHIPYYITRIRSL